MKHKVIFFSILMIVLTVPYSVNADIISYTYQGKTLDYNLVNGEAWVINNNYTSPAYPNLSGTLVIPNSVIYNGTTYPVTKIGNEAFYNCSGMTSVTIPNSVTTIGNSAFGGCSGLTSIVIPNSVTTMGSYVFRFCSSLTSVTIPNSIITIGAYTFFGCNSLTSVIIPNSVTSIGISAFQSCDGLTSVTIPNSVTSIGNSAFFNCSSLTSVVIPRSITSIDNSVFCYCSSLTSVTIPNSVTSIGDYAFAYCSSLTEITCFAAVAPTLGTDALINVPSSITIYIPCQSQPSYLSQWSYFSNFVEEFEYSIVTQSADISMGTVTTLSQPTCTTPTATVSATANNGYHFDHWSDGNTDNPRSLTVTQDTSITAYFELANNDTIHDTTYISVHDTTILHDTIYLPYFVHDTTTMYDTLYVTVHDTIIAYVNVPVHDTIIAYINVPVHDTVYLPQYIYDTLWLHDTIIIHDTVYITQEGIEGVDALNAKVYTNDGQIVVDGAEANTVTLYDAIGRILASKQSNYNSLRFDIPVSGTYMIKIGNHPARKMVVIR